MTWLFIALAAATTDHLDDSLAWRWEEPHRYYLETKVQLPSLMWFAKRFNEQARVAAFEVRLVTSCAPGERVGRVMEVYCRLDDVGIRASGTVQEEGLLQPILEEMDERLTGARVQLQVRPDGRLVNIDLEDLDRRNRRIGQVNENIRLVVSRAFAGFDLPLPRVSTDPQWVQRSAWLMRAPATQGSIGVSDLVHAQHGGALVEIISGGRGLIVPADSGNQYDARFEGRASFDRRRGELLDREWTVVGAPTPSSTLAEGTEGYPYIQQGRLYSLAGADVDPSVGLTEALPPRETATALQADYFLGLTP
jgi:hypothetical protein